MNRIDMAIVEEADEAEFLLTLTDWLVVVVLVDDAPAVADDDVFEGSDPLPDWRLAGTCALAINIFDCSSNKRNSVKSLKETAAPTVVLNEKDCVPPPADGFTGVSESVTPLGSFPLPPYHFVVPGPFKNLKSLTAN